MNAGDPSAGPSICPSLVYEDAPAAIAWLRDAFGFKEHLVIPGAPGTVAHAELRLGSGIVMIGSARRQNDVGVASPRWVAAVTGAVYVAVKDVEAHHARATVAGAEMVRDLADTDHGREYTARDLEGHLWVFGAYRPSRPA